MAGEQVLQALSIPAGVRTKIGIDVQGWAADKRTELPVL